MAGGYRSPTSKGYEQIGDAFAAVGRRLSEGEEPSGSALSSSSSQLATAMPAFSFSTDPAWRIPYRQDNASIAMVDGRLTLYPIVIPEFLVLEGMAIYCTSGAASTTTAAALFDDLSWSPNNLIKASSAFDTSSSGLKSEVFTEQGISKGVYWLGALSMGGAPSMERAIDVNDMWSSLSAGTDPTPAVTAGSDGKLRQQTLLTSVPSIFTPDSTDLTSNARVAVWLRLRRS